MCPASVKRVPEMFVHNPLVGCKRPVHWPGLVFWGFWHDSEPNSERIMCTYVHFEDIAEYIVFEKEKLSELLNES